MKNGKKDFFRDLKAQREVIYWVNGFPHIYFSVLNVFNNNYGKILSTATTIN